MKIFIYILQLSNGKYYTGITNDINRRLNEHNDGKSLSTKYYLPFNLIMVAVRDSYVKARMLEVQIKTTGANKYLNKLLSSPQKDFLYIDKIFTQHIFISNNRWKNIDLYTVQTIQ